MRIKDEIPNGILCYERWSKHRLIDLKVVNEHVWTLAGKLKNMFRFHSTISNGILIKLEITFYL